MVDSHSDHPLLYKAGLICGNWKWIWADSPPPEMDSGFSCLMQLRHRMEPVRCKVWRYLHNRFRQVLAQANGFSGSMTFTWEYPSANRKRVSLKVKSRLYGMEIGVLEAEPSYLPPNHRMRAAEVRVVLTTGVSVRTGNSRV